MKKYALIALYVGVLLLLPTATSETFSKTFTDDTNDVSGLNGTVDAPDVDIEQITYYQDGKTVVTTLKVVGKIDDESSYQIALTTNAGDNDTNTNYIYTIFYTNDPSYNSNLFENFSTSSCKCPGILSDHICLGILSKAKK